MLYSKQCTAENGRPFTLTIEADGPACAVLERLGYVDEWTAAARVREAAKAQRTADRLAAMRAGLCPGGCGKAPKRCTCDAPPEETEAQRAAALASPADVVLDAQRLEE